MMIVEKGRKDMVKRREILDLTVTRKVNQLIKKTLIIFEL